MADGMLALHPGRSVSLLPRAGGHAWAGLLTDWQETGDDHVLAHVQTDLAAIDALDHHQVWLSTVGKFDDEDGVTIFAGRALAQDDGSLLVDGVVRLVSERRRRSVRAAGAKVRLPDQDGHPGATLAATDVSRGGLRLAMNGTGWTYDHDVTVTVELPDAATVTATARLLRQEEGDVVLELDDLAELDGAAIDRYALSQVEETGLTTD
jgi:hypothetical protein